MYLVTKEVSINGDLVCDFIEGLHFGVLFGSFKELKKYNYLHNIEEEFKVIEDDDNNTEPFEDNYDIEANF